MKQSFLKATVMACMVSIAVFSFSSSVMAQSSVLAKVILNDSLESLNLPVYAHLVSKSGEEYALVFATEEELTNRGVTYDVLYDTSQKRDNSAYFLAYERIEGSLSAAHEKVTVLHDDGKQIVVIGTKKDADLLASMGLELRMIQESPMKFQSPVPQASETKLNSVMEYSDAIGDMINKVSQSTLSKYTGDLSGENTVKIGGSSYKIETRATGNKTWIDRVTQYTYDWFASKGYSVSYHNWSNYFNSSRNVVAEKKGTKKPSEIVLITGHLDNVPSSGRAPGADDNASGSVGVMVAAEIMANYKFERTVRFVHFTGEEQGLHGSAEYAKACANKSENIVAVLNLDMIAWDSKGGPVARIHTRTTTSSGYAKDKALADTFINVVKTYGLSSSLDAIIDPDGISYSDHSSFWNNGYPAILAIEDDDDFNAYYHTVDDTLANCNMPYFTAYTKACVGAAASFAIPEGSVPPTDNVTLNVSIEGKGSVTLDPPGGTYKKGTRVTLRATPDKGESFKNWSGDLTGTTNPATVTMDANKNVTAVFTGGGSDPNSCKGYCGNQAPGGCWCDNSCSQYGDCCKDKVQQCGY